MPRGWTIDKGALNLPQQLTLMAVDGLRCVLLASSFEEQPLGLQALGDISRLYGEEERCTDISASTSSAMAQGPVKSLPLGGG